VVTVDTVDERLKGIDLPDDTPEFVLAHTAHGGGTSIQHEKGFAGLCLLPEDAAALQVLDRGSDDL